LKIRLEHFPQCHIFPHTPPGGCPNVNTQSALHTTCDLCKMFFSQYCLVAAVLYIHLISSQICVYVHMFFTIRRLWLGKRNKKIWESSECYMPLVWQSLVIHSFHSHSMDPYKVTVPYGYRNGQQTVQLYDYSNVMHGLILCPMVVLLDPL